MTGRTCSDCDNPISRTSKGQCRVCYGKQSYIQPASPPPPVARPARRAPGSYAGLTVKQAELLSYIRARAMKNETPSYDEMSAALGLLSKSGVHRLLTSLEERGYVERTPNRARAIIANDFGRKLPPLIDFPLSHLLAEIERRGLRITAG